MRGVSLVVLAAASAFAADPPPSWLREAATREAPAFPARTPAVVLHDEEEVSVAEDGKVERRARHAVRILTRQGRLSALARIVYRTDGGRVRDLKAWLIRGQRVPKAYGKDDAADVAFIGADLYNEIRARVIAGSVDAEAGDVFGYEALSEDRSVFTQFSWEFGGRLPVMFSRFALRVPGGWKAESSTINHEEIGAEVSGGVYSWTLRNPPWFEPEPASPSDGATGPRLAVSYYPPPGHGGMGRVLREWREVSQWMAELSDPAAAPDGAVSARAKVLTANASGEWETLKALAEFVQKVRYISIQMGLARGGGYRPRAAAQVFATSYGDCKDKATLLRALLASVGVESRLVAIHAFDRDYVRESWPSPQQFNHAILAIRVSGDVQAPAVLDHPRLGRLLLFDPTDEFTPFGHLPENEQGSLALVIQGRDGELVRVPSAPPEASRTDRATRVKLSAEGAAAVEVEERHTGIPAIRAAREFRRLPRAEFEKAIDDRILGNAPSARRTALDASQDGPASFRLRLEFTAADLGQLMQSRLLVFRAPVFGEDGLPGLSKEQRRQPVVVEAWNISEDVAVELPRGFVVDEMPKPVRIRRPFGEFGAAWERGEGRLTLRWRLRTDRTVVPREEYESVRSFFAFARGSGSTPVVLMKQ